MHVPARSRRIVLPAALAQLFALTMAVAQTDLDSGDAMPDDDLDRLLAVNEGELQFLSEHPAGSSPLTIHSAIHIRPHSLHDGWVGLDQCQSKLDPISAAEIQYSYRGMRDLRITEMSGIDSAWVDESGVQLRGVKESARVCIAAEVQILRAGDERYELGMGPFHRRFLDGYFPLQLQLALHYPADLLAWAGMEPPPQPGLTLRYEPGSVEIETRFTGRLQLQFSFDPVRP